MRMRMRIGIRSLFHTRIGIGSLFLPLSSLEQHRVCSCGSNSQALLLISFILLQLLQACVDRSLRAEKDKRKQGETMEKK